jgi:hypothetical protein
MYGNSRLSATLSIFGLPWLTVASCIIALFFLSRSNGMATDIGSLALGLDEHVVRLGIERKVLRKIGETFTIFFICTPVLM